MRCRECDPQNRSGISGIEDPIVAYSRRREIGLLFMAYLGLDEGLALCVCIFVEVLASAFGRGPGDDA